MIYDNVRPTLFNISKWLRSTFVANFALGVLQVDLHRPDAGWITKSDPNSFAWLSEHFRVYNLFVSGLEKNWEGEPFLLELKRCVDSSEYTSEEVAAEYGELDDQAMKALRRLPCIFAYEGYVRKNPKFGRILSLTKHSGRIRIEYQIEQLEAFIDAADLEYSLKFALDIDDLEMNRTHWAVKNIDLERELRKCGIKLPGWTKTKTAIVDVSTHRFAVALSFAGEFRNYVGRVAAELEPLLGSNACFFDENYKSQLARASLDTLLQDIYRNRSELLVVFLCHNYKTKEWCGIEFKAIRDIFLNKKIYERVMFVRMEPCEVEGVFDSDGYIDGQKHSAEELAGFIEERVTLLRGVTDAENNSE